MMKSIILQRFKFLFLLLSLILSGLALYQHWQLKYSGGTAKGFCEGRSAIGCDSVALSPWAEPVFGLPVAALLMGLLLLIVILEFLPKVRDRIGRLYALMAVGSLFYLGTMFLTMPKVCGLCLGIHACLWTAILLKYFSIDRALLWVKLDRWVGVAAMLAPLLLAAALQQFGLPALRSYKKWERVSITKRDFRTVAPPILPPDAPKIILGNPKGKKISMIVASDFSCLHCREHFFELSRALMAEGYHAEVSILLDPLESECNPLGDENHSGACNAARVGLCQYERGKFDGFFRNIYLSPSRAMGNPETLWKMESNNSQEQQEIELCVASEQTQKKLSSHIEVVLQSNVMGTPVTWLGGFKFEGQLGWRDWSEVFKRVE